MIQLIKIITGELVIADVTENTGVAGTITSLTLKNPMVILLGERGLGMSPLAPFIENDKLEILIDKVIFRGKADAEIVNPYNAKFGSGIVTAPAGIIGRI